MGSVHENQKIIVIEETVLREKKERLKVVLNGALARDEKLRTRKTSTIIVTGSMIVRREGRKENVFKPCLDANSFEIPEVQETVGIPTEEVEKWKQMIALPEFYPKLIKSICPSTFGMEREKEAFILSALKGVEKIKEGGSKTRDEIHILIVGDPSMAKTKIAEWCVSNILPNSRLVSGGDTSGVGVTAAVVKNEGGEYELRPGAMSLCNGGFVIVDEFNKMDPGTASKFNMGMETQKITIDKGGIHENLPADTAVIAIANPEGGGYIDRFKSMKDQLPEGITESLMTRFDVPLITRDIPDEIRDKKISEKILGMEVLQEGEYFDPQFVNRFLTYARELRPLMNNGERETVSNFYVQMRKIDNENFKVSPRFLESLQRISEARAKADLSDVVGIQHVKFALHFIASCYKDLDFDHGALTRIIDATLSGKTEEPEDYLHIDVDNKLDAWRNSSLAGSELSSDQLLTKFIISDDELIHFVTVGLVMESHPGKYMLVGGCA